MVKRAFEEALWLLGTSKGRLLAICSMLAGASIAVIKHAVKRQVLNNSYAAAQTYMGGLGGIQMSKTLGRPVAGGAIILEPIAHTETESEDQKSI